jgi:hypothetical protein
MSRFSVIVLVCLTLFPTHLFAADPADLVVGVNEITAFPGAPGPVFPVDDEWWSIAAGDDDTTFPSLYVVAREFGAGTVVAMGHESIISDNSFSHLDNRVFLSNVTDWLDTTDQKQVAFTSGHSEFVRAFNLNEYIAEMSSKGFSVTQLSAPIDLSQLSQHSVLIIGNAWGDFTQGEIDDIEQWVAAGGGLMLLGLGWSWPFEIEDYPMTKVAEPYGVRWLRDFILDPTNNLNGSPVFHTFYPDIFQFGRNEAFSVILSSHQQHGSQLVPELESNASLQREFVRAHKTLDVLVYVLALDDPDRAAIYDFYLNLAQQFPDYYAKRAPHDPVLHPTSAWIRERFWRTWRDTQELTDTRINEMAGAGELTGRYFDLLREFGVVLHDNVMMQHPEQDFIFRYLSSIPRSLHNMRSISVRDFLGDPPLQLDLDGEPGGVNVFGNEIGTVPENSFPSDVEPGFVDQFAVVVAHEINHVVDVFTVTASGELDARRDMLIADAGCEPMNYLRSMFPSCFFVDFPQELFASISNQWFTDSALTVELGIVRFEAGFPDPINQALFIADVYSEGRNHTIVYEIDTQGVIERRLVPISRDGHGFISGILLEGIQFTFDLDSLGRVLSISSRPVDDDGDGIPDSDDACPESNLSAFIVIEGCNTGVPNHLLNSGCTISDEISQCAAAVTNHGKFVSCVAKLTQQLKELEIISGNEKGKIVSCAATLQDIST